jgi:type II secretory pathway pseudopilin PulG
MRKGQVWIETVLYTLIGLALIGVVLAIASPRINESKDRLVVEQSIEALNTFDQKIFSALDGSAGNIRKVDSFRMKRGSLTIDQGSESIYFVLEDLGKPYSEPGVEVKDGRITILTEELPNSYKVKLTVEYESADIIFEGEPVKVYSAATTAYSFEVTNLGDSNNDGKAELRIEEVSGR